MIVAIPTIQSYMYVAKTEVMMMMIVMVMMLITVMIMMLGVMR